VSVEPNHCSLADLSELFNRASPQGWPSRTSVLSSAGFRRATLQVLSPRCGGRGSWDFYPHVSGILGSAYAASAVIYASLGETEKGLKSLERGIAERDVFLAENFFDPLLDRLRKEPEFAKMERAMGLIR
jgi:hypothetical protein